MGYFEKSAAVALGYFAYNFIKIHRTLRVTPAMAAGVTDRLWDVEDLVAAWESSERRAERQAAQKSDNSQSVNPALNRILLIALFAYSASAIQPKLTLPEARRLAVSAMPKEARNRGVTIELDREQSGCAIYHAYVISGSEPEFNTATLGWWSVDLRTGEVWNELGSERITGDKISRMQRKIRKRLAVSSSEVSASIASPCYERYSK